MAEVKVNIQRTLRVGWSPEEAFAMVADVPRSASHFPGLQRLEDLGDGVYRWHLSSFRIGKITFPVSYAARYVPDPEAGTVTWSTDPGSKNTRADGKWVVTPDGDGALLEFHNHLVVVLPVPRMIMRMANKIARNLTEKQIGAYLGRISRAMDGEVLR
jgi:carbon monoxide dehydrogenase subunit G